MNNESTGSLLTAEQILELTEIVKGFFTKEELEKMEVEYNKMLQQQKQN